MQPSIRRYILGVKNCNELEGEVWRRTSVKGSTVSQLDVESSSLRDRQTDRQTGGELLLSYIRLALNRPSLLGLETSQTPHRLALALAPTPRVQADNNTMVA